MQRTKHTSSKFRILTNDPSVTAWGWAVLSADSTILEAGCIKTEPDYKTKRIRKGDDTCRRVSEINQQLKEIIRKWGVQYILAELPHGSQNASAAVMIGIVIGIVQTISDMTELGVEWYSEGDSKKCLLGKLSATKQETKDAVDKYYNVPWTGIKYRDEAIADAIAIHYVASKQSSILQLMKTRKL